MVEAVELIEASTTPGGTERWVMGGIRLQLTGGSYLAVYNALDELGLAAERSTENGPLRAIRL